MNSNRPENKDESNKISSITGPLDQNERKAIFKKKNVI